jgi:hypothetical protein
MREEMEEILNFKFWILDWEEDEEVVFYGDLRSIICYFFLYDFADLGAGCSKDGLGQDVPAARKRCPAGCVAQREGRRRSPLIKRLICLPSSVL